MCNSCAKMNALAFFPAIKTAVLGTDNMCVVGLGDTITRKKRRSIAFFARTAVQDCNPHLQLQPSEVAAELPRVQSKRLVRERCRRPYFHVITEGAAEKYVLRHGATELR